MCAHWVKTRLRKVNIAFHPGPFFSALDLSFQWQPKLQVSIGFSMWKIINCKTMCWLLLCLSWQVIIQTIMFKQRKSKNCNKTFRSYNMSSPLVGNRRVAPSLIALTSASILELTHMKGAIPKGIQVGGCLPPLYFSAPVHNFHNYVFLPPFSSYCSPTCYQVPTVKYITVYKATSFVRQDAF